MRFLRLRNLCLAAALGAAAPLATAAAQEGTPPNAVADSTLGRLIGEWLMVGTVQGDSVVYTLSVERVLMGRFVALHMRDAATPSQYEARVLVGADTLSPRILVHWLDSFGAAYSVPTGAGTARGDTIAFTIPYASGTFRDVLSATGDGSWRLLIESQAGATWQTFADYRIVPLLPMSRPVTRELAENPRPADAMAMQRRLAAATQEILSDDDRLVGSDRTVRLELLIDADGTMRGARVVSSSGHAAIDAAALRILRSTRFVPATSGGQPVASRVLQPVRFVFPED